MARERKKSAKQQAADAALAENADAKVSAAAVSKRYSKTSGRWDDAGWERWLAKLRKHKAEQIMATAECRSAWPRTRGSPTGSARSGSSRRSSTAASPAHCRRTMACMQIAWLVADHDGASLKPLNKLYLQVIPAAAPHSTPKLCTRPRHTASLPP